MLKVSDFASPDEPMAIASYRLCRDKLITEATTDFLIDLFKNRLKLKWLPFVGDKLIAGMLDKFLPEGLLDILKQIILKTGLATEADFTRMDSPLRPI